MPTTQTTSPVEPAQSSRTGAAGWVTPVALGMIVAHLLVRAWAVWGGSFFGDDFVFLADVARGDADVAWIFHRHNVHLMPLGFLLVLPVAAAGAFAWHVAALEIVAMHALAALACWWMLRTLFGNRPGILVPLGFYLFSAISIPATMWWAAAVNMIAVQPAIFVAVTAHVLFVRTGRRGFALLAGLALLLGLGVYVKALLIPVVLVALTVGSFLDGPLAERLRTTLRRHWFAWSTYAVVGVGYLAAYFSLGRTPTDEGSVDLVGLVQNSVLGALAPGLLGGPWHWVPADVENGPRALSDPPQLVQTLSAIVLVLVVVYLAARRRGALAPLWYLVPYAVATVGLLAAGRVATFGTAITMEIRYWTDFLPYVALAFGAMTMPLLGAARPLAERDPVLLAWEAPRWLVASLCVGYLAGGLWSTATYVSSWHDPFLAKTYIRTAEASVEAHDPPVALANDNVPEAVLQGLTYPYNRIDHILAPLGGRITTPSAANDLAVLDGGGEVRPGIARPDLVVPATSLRQCLTGPTLGYQRVALGQTTFDFPFWASIVYRSDARTRATVVAGATSHDIELLPGLHTLTLRTEGSYDQVSFRLRDPATVCLSGIQIGQVMTPR